MFSNSPLVNYTCISPNKSNGRIVPTSWAKRWDGEILDTITIHCVVGQTSVERLGEIFADPGRQASSNYGIGADGRIGMYVEEKDRSWCTGGPKNVLGMTGSMNDYRAVTIEVASDTEYPYAVTDEAYATLIKLVADICKRNGIKRLKWEADPNLVWDKDRQNMTVHRWFDYKSCPGEFLFERHHDIASKVNALLKPTPQPSDRVPLNGVWDRQDTAALQIIFDCQIIDGEVSRQPKSNKEFLPNVDGCFQFKGWPWYIGGSALIKAMQDWVGGKRDGYAGKEFVTKWQIAMRDNNYYHGAIDGSFGPQTALATEEYINDWFRRHPEA